MLISCLLLLSSLLLLLLLILRFGLLLLLYLILLFIQLVGLLANSDANNGTESVAPVACSFPEACVKTNIVTYSPPPTKVGILVLTFVCLCNPDTITGTGADIVIDFFISETETCADGCCGPVLSLKMLNKK